MNVKRNEKFWLIMLVLSSSFVLIYLSLTGNRNQAYNDIIAEFTSMFSSNKTAERNLIFLLCFGGIFLYSVYYFVNRKELSAEIDGKNALSKESKVKDVLCILIAMAVVSLIVWGTVNQVVASGIFFAVLLYIIDCELVISGICIYFMTVYTCIALYRVYVFYGGASSGNIMTAVLLSLVVLFLQLLLAVNKKRCFLRLGLVENIIIPFALLLYTVNRYTMGEQIFEINVSTAVINVIWAIIIVFSFIALVSAIKKWNTIESIEQVIEMGTCVTIMAFNRFDGSGAIMPADLHHPFENIIGYSQVFELGRIPFKEYIPVSGMYSLIQGAIFKWFGNGGTFSNYYITNNLFYLFVIISIVWLLKKHLDNTYVFWISLIFYVQSYNRLVFILPIMLLLTWPKLIEHENTVSA